MMKAFFLSSLSLLLLAPSQAWIQQRHHHSTAAASPLRSSGKGGGEAVQTDDPCWQNMLDDDCSMGDVYSSSFVAAKWIKSMPCGEGIEVSFCKVPGVSFGSRVCSQQAK